MKYYCFVILCVLVVCGCSHPISAAGGYPTSSPVSSSQSFVDPPSPINNLPFTSTIIAPTATSNCIATSNSIATPNCNAPSFFTSQLTPSKTSIPPLEMCSPIGGITLRDLPHIISVGYLPEPKCSYPQHMGVDFCFYQWNDLGSIEGRSVQSVLSGWIAAALDGTFPYGSFVIVETPADRIPQSLRKTLKLDSDESLYALYAHLQDKSFKVHLGQEISACQILGSVGRTGNTYAPHLHFETRIGPPGARFIEMSNFTEFATDGERKNYRIWVAGSYDPFDPMNLLTYGIEAAQ